MVDLPGSRMDAFQVPVHGSCAWEPVRLPDSISWGCCNANDILLHVSMKIDSAGCWCFQGRLTHRGARHPRCWADPGLSDHDQGLEPSLSPF